MIGLRVRGEDDTPSILIMILRQKLEPFCNP
jgi:hypothetical protein